MKRAVVVFLILLAAATSADAGPRDVGRETVALGDVIHLADVVMLTRQSLSDDTVIAFLEQRALPQALDAEDVSALAAAGVGERVIRYLIARRPARYRSDPPYRYNPSNGYGAYGYLAYPYLSYSPLSYYDHDYGAHAPHHGFGHAWSGHFGGDHHGSHGSGHGSGHH